MRKIITGSGGGEVLRIMRDHAEQLGIDADVFDLVFEGFWDIYLFHPQVDEVSGKKMLNWIPKVRLHVNETTRRDEEGAEKPEDEPADEGKATERGNKGEPLCAVVRIRVPKQKSTPEEDEEGNVKEIETPESDLED